MIVQFDRKNFLLTLEGFQFSYHMNKILKRLHEIRKFKLIIKHLILIVTNVELKVYWDVII